MIGAVEAVDKSGAGNRDLRGRSLSLRARGSAFPHVPGSPGGACPQVGESGKGTGVEDVRDEPLYRSRVCGIDVGKAELYATIRVPSDKNPARRASETRSFATTSGGC